MNVKQRNGLLSRGEIDREDLWPKMIEMEAKAAQFRFDFGLKELPTEPGILIIRGPRQYGKSTWLEEELRWTIQKFGKGTAYYLNGDEINSDEELEQNLLDLITAFDRDAKVRRIFIDEITSVPSWEKGIKRLVDQGHLKEILLITTGSKARDLRRGSERLPGRKGRLKRTDFFFLPISYSEFYENCGQELGEKSWIAYLLSGGSPIGANDIFQFERLPEYFLDLTQDWIYGELAESGRSRILLNNLLRALFRFGGTPLGFAKLARESGMANNTVASGYIEHLADLMSVIPLWPWDHSRKMLLPRKPCKFPFINLSAAIAFHPKKPIMIHEFENLKSDEKSQLLEWLICQELWRRSALEGRNPEELGFWQSKDHEIDFVTPEEEFFEVKLGQAGPLDFSWFSKIFPNKRLTVICQTPFETKQIRGVTPHQFLLGDKENSDE